VLAARLTTGERMLMVFVITKDTPLSVKVSVPGPGLLDGVVVGSGKPLAP